MPSSRAHTIPTVIHLVRQIKPESILDVGIGFGKWGHLFREYTDILAAERDPPRYQRPNWKVRIDGIEGHAAYVTDMHRYLYDDIHVGDACTILPFLQRYDLIFMGDIIEHLEKEQGSKLLRDAIAKANKAVVVSTPRGDTGQEDLCGNELERHRSVWSAKEFRAFEEARVITIERATLIAVIPRPGVTLTLRPQQGGASNLRRMADAKAEMCRLIPHADTWILVDEEQIRSALPHGRALPFLEHDNKYWGPPADDAAAIEELERLRLTGAKYIAFIWSTFWWLDHYAGFATHLRSKYDCVHESESSVVFRL